MCLCACGLDVCEGPLALASTHSPPPLNRRLHQSSLPPHTPPENSNERRAFLDPYAQFARFSDGSGALLLDEFLDAKDAVAALSAEYEACERPDYVSACCCVLCFGRGGGAAALGLQLGFDCRGCVCRKGWQSGGAASAFCLLQRADRVWSPSPSSSADAHPPSSYLPSSVFASPYNTHNTQIQASAAC